MDFGGVTMKNITFREATAEDAKYVASRLRKADVAEVLALGCPPEKAVETSRNASDFAWTALINGEPVMLFGCGCSLTSPVAEVWALGTDACTAVPRDMLVYGRQKIREMLDIYPEMQNYCDARYTAAHRWLKKLGFVIGDPVPYGPKGSLFCKIYIRKEGL